MRMVKRVSCRVTEFRTQCYTLILVTVLSTAVAIAGEDEWLSVKGPGYAGGSVQWGDGVAGIELSGERYWKDLASYYASAGILSAHDFDERFYSLSVGTRTAFPAPVYPFVGLGGYFGLSDAEAEFVTTDGQKSSLSLVFNGLAVYPEVGLHIGFGARSRLLATARYYTDLDDDHPRLWAFGAGLSVRWD